MIRPHGGKLINKKLTKNKAALLCKNKALPRVVINYDSSLDLENIAVGAYSPLSGFMTKEEFKSVLFKKRLPNGLPWTIPIVLSVERKDAKKLSRNSHVLLCNGENAPIGALKIKDIYAIDKTKAAKKIFSTENRKHPGVRKFYEMGDVFVGGEIWLIEKNIYSGQGFNMEPSKTRELIAKRKWKTVAGFQTRNIPHRAHEFLHKIALQAVEAIFIHPIIGWKKKGDFTPDMIMGAYKVLMKHYYSEDNSMISGLATAMRYAGPREAIFHAIIRKNFGCTHFIVGRDHAGVGGFYDTYAAHRIFDKFPDLGITPVLLRGPYYCKKCLSVVNDAICPHFNTNHKLEISGTAVRNMLLQNKQIPEEYLRKEVSDFIYEQRDKCFI